MVALVGLFIACGGSKDDEDSCSSGEPGCPPVITEQISQFLESREEANAAECLCRSVRGWVGNFDECTAETLPSPDDLSGCLVDVAEKRAGVGSNLECASGVEEDFADCLSDSSCSEEDYKSCFTDYFDSFAACPEITESVIRELNGCF